MTVQTIMQTLGSNAKQAFKQLAIASTATKNKALQSIATLIRENESDILKANKKDVALAEQSEMTTALIDRLRLTAERIAAMADGIDAIADLSDPVGKVLAEWERPNGLHIKRVSVPLGVIGVIYESRPNVTADAAALCLKAGNAVILRGGSDSFHSASAIMQCITQGLTAAALPEHAVQMLPSSDRALVGAMLKMDDYIDVIVPRGGKSLIQRITQESRIPLFKHLEGICHTYIHAPADLEMARSILINAKMRRPGICGATETLLIDAFLEQTFLPTLINDLIESNCEVRGAQNIQQINNQVKPVSEDDWDTEYLEAIISVKTVASIDEAINHINQHGSQHTDAIITSDAQAAQRFLNEVDSAIVMHNTSTQFADGGEFGMGAEIGISTGKLHARGPVGVEQLTTFKYQVEGCGQTRPL